MSGIICNLKAFSKDIYEGQQVLTHADHLKTFTKIQSHLKIKEECIKMFGTPNVAHVAKGIGLKATTRIIEVSQLRKAHAPSKR